MFQDIESQDVIESSQIEDGNEKNITDSKIIRKSTNFEDLSVNFKYGAKDKNFQRQFAHIYTERLFKLRPILIDAADKIYDDIPHFKLKDLKSDERCIITGTLFKDMKLRPTILKEISENNDLPFQPLDCYMDESDEIYLEDEVQRILLVGDISPSNYVTGVTLAVIGIEKDSDPGKFYVEDIILAPLPDQVDKPILNEDRYVAFISGLNLDGENDDLVSLQLLVDILVGHIGSNDDQNCISNIVQCIVAGDCLSEKTNEKDDAQKAKYLSKKIKAASVDAVKELDEFFSQIAANMNLTVLPGKNDPTNLALPQQPFHKCMFPKSSKYPSFNLTTNPCLLNIEGFQILGHSGYPLINIEMYSSLKSDINLLEKTLLWRHLAPTAPDTLCCYPLYDRDPFIIENTPHVLFAGNQKHLQWRNVCEQNKDILLLTIPKFSDSKSIVILNLRNFKVKNFTIDTEF